MDEGERASKQYLVDEMEIKEWMQMKEYRVALLCGHGCMRKDTGKRKK